MDDHADGASEPSGQPPVAPPRPWWRPRSRLLAAGATTVIALVAAGAIAVPTLSRISRPPTASPGTPLPSPARAANEVTTPATASSLPSVSPSSLAASPAAAVSPSAPSSSRQAGATGTCSGQAFSGPINVTCSVSSSTAASSVEWVVSVTLSYQGSDSFDFSQAPGVSFGVSTLSPSGLPPTSPPAATIASYPSGCALLTAPASVILTSWTAQCDLPAQVGNLQWSGSFTIDAPRSAALYPIVFVGEYSYSPPPPSTPAPDCPSAPSSPTPVPAPTPCASQTASPSQPMVVAPPSHGEAYADGSLRVG